MINVGSASNLLTRLLPPVQIVGDDGHPKPTRMKPEEQWVAAGLGLANVAIALGASRSIESKPDAFLSTPQAQGLALLIGLAAAAIAVVGARKGNRLVAMVGLFAATLFRPSSVAAFLPILLPYYGAAVWMFLRYNRLVKAQAVLRRQQRGETRGTRTDRRSRAQGKGAMSTSTESVKKPVRPTASKRYTPPKPVRKPPPPPSKPPRDRSIVD